MLDANGRPVRVGDTVATPYPTDDLARLPERIQGAILGTVIEIAEDFNGEFVHLGDGIFYGPEDIVTLGGLEWVTCQECGESWPFDVRMSVEEECPFCDTPHRMSSLISLDHTDLAEEAELEEYRAGLSIGPVY